MHGRQLAADRAAMEREILPAYRHHYCDYDALKAALERAETDEMDSMLSTPRLGDGAELAAYTSTRSYGYISIKRPP
jgi:hypothetical protein